MSNIDLQGNARISSASPDNFFAPDATAASVPGTEGETSADWKPSDALRIDGADLLYRIQEFTQRFILYPSRTSSITHTLWIAHTYLMEAWFTTARLAVLSPEPGSGKSRVLEISKLLVPNPVLSVTASAAYILRKVADQANRPTILCDEIDTIFGSKAKGNEDLRGLLNAGYRRGASVGRCVEEKGKFIPTEFPTFAAVAMGGLGSLPDTIMTRSVIIRMRKRERGEIVEDFRPRLHEPIGDALREEIAAWAASIVELAKDAQPVLPDGINDRIADVWSPLLTVADFAGGAWPDLARKAAVESVISAKINERPSLTTQLLADIRTCFGDNDRMTSADLVESLLADEEAPWGDLSGKKLNARVLGGILREYQIRSGSIRLKDGSTPKGYMRTSFEDAWRRYLPPAEIAATSATPPQGH